MRNGRTKILPQKENRNKKNTKIQRRHEKRGRTRKKNKFIKIKKRRL